MEKHHTFKHGTPELGLHHTSVENYCDWGNKVQIVVVHYNGARALLVPSNIRYVLQVWGVNPSNPNAATLKNSHFLT
jgi:hypothetical protein